MRPIRIRKVWRICSVKGCSNHDCFNIARSSEPGNSVIMCRDCIKDIYNAVFDEPEQTAEAVTTDTVKKIAAGTSRKSNRNKNK